MGNLLPAGALGRQLTWNDFATRQAPAPGPGQNATAAETRVTRLLSPNRFTFSRAVYLRPPNFTMDQDPDVTIRFETNSWVASWVASSPAAFQASLLEHEQGHYDISSLNAGDFFGELQDINGSAFVSAQAGRARVADTISRLGRTQPIHDKYDTDTNHGLRPARQALWTAAFAAARAPGATLLGALASAGLFP
ncbi:MAG: hypothetical protein KGM15_06755 [Pseudomonadota bacterium]|nr:hypothetical protein [Pseudomonadota bacterium]